MLSVFFSEPTEFFFSGQLFKSSAMKFLFFAALVPGLFAATPLSPTAFFVDLNPDMSQGKDNSHLKISTGDPQKDATLSMLAKFGAEKAVHVTETQGTHCVLSIVDIFAALEAFDSKSVQKQFQTDLNGVKSANRITSSKEQLTKLVSSFLET